MPPGWIKRADGTEGADDAPKFGEIKPEDMQKAVKPLLDQMKADNDAAMKPMLDYFAEQKAERERKAAAEESARRQQTRTDNEVNPEDWITDPMNATRKMMEPLQQTNATLAAIIVRDKTLGKMEHYGDNPAFAAKVDALISAQPLQNQSNAQVILNAYKSVHYDMREELAEDRKKREAAGASFSNNGTGGHSGSKGEESTETLSAEEKVYAQKFGISDADWIKQKREMEYV
jgi:hypothetical protein